jgi:adenosine deaminase
MLRHGMCVSICTDNRLVSNTSVCHEMMLALTHFKISPAMLKTIIIESFKRCVALRVAAHKRVVVVEPPSQ